MEGPTLRSRSQCTTGDLIHALYCIPDPSFSKIGYILRNTEARAAKTLSVDKATYTDKKAENLEMGRVKVAIG